jgi:hypothetical protein
VECGTPKAAIRKRQGVSDCFQQGRSRGGVPKVDDPDLRPLWEYLKGLDGAEVKK